MKVKVAVLGSPSLTSLMVYVVAQHQEIKKKEERFSGQSTGAD